MRFIPLIVLVLVGLSAPVLAQDAVAGKTKAAVCSACHGAEGISVLPDYPNLAGQKVKYLETSIKAYRDGVRKHAVMSPMAWQGTATRWRSLVPGSCHPPVRGVCRAATPTAAAARASIHAPLTT
mgnify:CR=1 FL=1